MKSKIAALTIILLLVISTIVWTHGREKEKGTNMSLLQKQPVFTLKIEGFGSVYFVIVNGVTVFRQYNPNAQVSTTIPVNHYMRSGNNSIRIATWSGDEAKINPHAKIEVDLMVNEFSTPNEVFTITNIDYTNNVSADGNLVKRSSLAGTFSSEQGFIESIDGDITTGKIESENDGYVFNFERVVDIPSSLPLWAFFNSDTLPDYQSMKKELYDHEKKTLFPFYQRLQDAIASNDIGSIIVMFEERNRELDIAFYNPPGTIEARIEKALKGAAVDDLAELVELEYKYVNFMKQENSLLVSLARDAENPAVGLNYKEHTGSYSFDMIFRKKDGEWILTR